MPRPIGSARMRDRDWGVGLLGLGVLTMFSTLAFKMYITFY